MKKLSGFIGQGYVVENLKVFIESAKKRKESLDHILFYGPPGLGKTTLAHIIAGEMHSKIHVTSGPLLSKAGDLAKDIVIALLGSKDIAVTKLSRFSFFMIFY